jgi:hypothetical protein
VTWSKQETWESTVAEFEYVNVLPEERLTIRSLFIYFTILYQLIHLRGVERDRPYMRVVLNKEMLGIMKKNGYGKFKLLFRYLRNMTGERLSSTFRIRPSSLFSLELIRKYKFYRQLIGLLGRLISPSQGRYLQKQHKHRKNSETSKPRVGFEPTIPVFEGAKTV